MGHNFFIKLLSYVLHSFTLFNFHKIKFKGKGYYLYKSRRNTLAPQFGYSHRLYIYSFFTLVRFLTKTKLVVFGLIKNDLIKSTLNLKTKRPINIFTGRGVR